MSNDDIKEVIRKSVAAARKNRSVRGGMWGVEYYAQEGAGITWSDRICPLGAVLIYPPLRGKFGPASDKYEAIANLFCVSKEWIYDFMAGVDRLRSPLHESEAYKLGKQIIEEIENERK